ncbi:MAG: glycosyltransferase family 39 protein [Synechococcales bacterium]|nr:glycosyltransferase family 39 protein [Synechococcales bacterium]
MLGLGLLCGLAFWYRLGSTGLLDETEPLFAESARQMTVTGNWITPYFNGVPRYDKPPLIYWLMAIAYKLLGVNEWSARIPSALAGTALVFFVTYVSHEWMARSSPSSEMTSVSHRLKARLIPSLPAVALILNLQMIFFARTGYSDMLLNFCFGGALLSFFLGYRQPDQPAIQRRWYLAFWGLMGLGVLTKGPVGFVLPGAIAGLLVLLTGQGRSVWREMPWRTGVGLFVGITLPWYGLVYLQKGTEFINSFFGFHNLERFTQVVNQHSGPWYYHFVMVLAGFFPWSLALPAAIATVIWDNIQQPPWQMLPDSQSLAEHRNRQLGLFALIWFAVVLIFFSIAQTKYITYSLPAIPAAALLVGLWWSRQSNLKQRAAQDQLAEDWNPQVLLWERFWRWFTIGLTILFCLALAIAARYSPMWLDDDPSMPNLVLRFWALQLPRIGLVIWLGAAIACVLLGLLRLSHHVWQVNLVAFSLFVLLFVLPSLTAIDTERQLPLRQIAAMTVKARQANEPLVMAVNTFEKPSLVFYTQQNFEFINRAARIPAYLAAQKVSSLLMVTTEDTLEEAKIQPDRYQMLAEAGIYELIRFSKVPQNQVLQEQMP